ncbi:putative hydro-lyase [Microbacterium paludicola]|uniref:Putative hydro-lyase E4U02_04510 n=1 Tax=Microbacterium paludicola TaxID=300019 RepID=A0A4Y9FWJ9_9MICO|nr:putative hydro-lyase [Microbacterium paludicola]MBF0815666.1 putative hydro-lyase [Microbacterium paludicola]TFU33713.1 putative hydro-lyase [Microbacterium paludicola]
MRADAVAEARAARAAYRAGRVAPTSGVAHGLVQANLISVPADWAYDVLLFAQRNPKPCPVLEVLDAGAVESRMAPGSDLRTDIPAYRIWRDGELAEETTDASAAWDEHPDLVSFLIGCSFTFEAGLADAGIPIRHRELDRNVPMYRTAQQCAPAGRLRGELVVSMRPIPAGRVADAVTISGRYPAVHGAPVHVGDPAALGIADLQAPEFGDAPEIRDGEVPVFWACGVTPQAAIMASRPPFAVTHAPGHMFLTDVPDAEYLA